jgi:hypothetical protein
MLWLRLFFYLMLQLAKTQWTNLRTHSQWRSKNQDLVFVNTGKFAIGTWSKGTFSEESLKPVAILYDLRLRF